MMRIRCKKASFLIFGTLLVLLIHRYKDMSDHKNVRLEWKDKPPSKAPQVHSYVYSWPKCERNMSAANITAFSTLPAHMQDFLYFRHCRHFPMLLDIPDKCGGPEESSLIFLFLVIKSSPGNYERREVLRKTWARERQHNGLWIRRIFISGTAGSGDEKMRLNKLLQVEQKFNNDILQWDFADSFFNLTLKQILFLEWMERNCPNIRFLLNGDDDVFAHTDNMVEYLQSLTDNDGGKHLFIGQVVEGGGPIREPLSKYFVPVQVHESNSYPAYCSGGGYLLSGYTASVIYNMSKSILLIPIDDVYMGMCLTKAGLRPESHMGVRTEILNLPKGKLDGYDPCFYKELLLVHRFLPTEMFLMWHQIQNPELKCSSSFKVL